jgi:hypothetical protein
MEVDAANAAKERILVRDRCVIAGLALALAILVVPAAVGAQEQYTFTVGLLGGLGGSLDAEVGDSLENTGYQLNATMVTESRTHVGLRAGRLGLDDQGLFGALSSAELTYATLGGEYRFRQSYNESGFYLGIGGYRLEGVDALGKDSDKTSLGLAVGVTGEFPIRRWIGLLFELSGHYVIDFDEAQFFALGQGGVAIHF